MTVTVSSFQADFPAFSSAPTASIQFWINVAGQLLDPSVWDTLLDPATELFVAHNVTLEPGWPGAVASSTNVGPLASKTVAQASASYDIAAGTIDGAGSWNLTTFGTRFYALREQMGAGGFEMLAIGSPPPLCGFW